VVEEKQLMRAEWIAYQGHFGPEYCQAILDHVLSQDPIDSRVGLNEQSDDNVRKSKLRFLYPEDKKLYYVFDHLWRLANYTNDQFFDFHITRLTALQIAEYKSEYKGEYKRHHDVFWLGGFKEEDKRYHRKLSCVIQLSDPNTYEGGDLELYDLFDKYPTKEELRPQGTCIFFPSFTYHAALPVTKGVRYSIAAWFEGPRWR
jgi:PKHD-type hydroxylase